MKIPVLVFALLPWVSASLVACPSCNIFNYLGRSVESSTEIWLVEVVELKEDYVARFEVTDVVRGSAKRGHQFEGKYYSNGRAIGDALIWSNPTGMPPSFPTVPAAWEREVRRIAFKDPIDDVETAVEFIQAISEEVRDWSKAYVAANFDACRPSLIAALNQRYEARNDANKDEFVGHRLEQLVSALLLKADSEAISALDVLTQRIATEKPDETLSSDRPFRGEAEGVVLRAMLTFAPESGEVRKRFETHLMDLLPEVVGTNVRWFSYALGDSPDCVDLFRSLPEEQHRAAAYGLFDLSRYHSSWWSHDASQRCRDAALSLYSGNDLASLVKKDEEWLDRFRRRDQP